MYVAEEDDNTEKCSFFLPITNIVSLFLFQFEVIESSVSTVS